MNAYQDILAYLDTIDIIDTHEHMSPFEPPFDGAKIPPRDQDMGVMSDQQTYDDSANVLDQLVMAGYLHNQTYASGLQADFSKGTLKERWQAFEPLWEAVRYTGYAQVVNIAISDILGFDEITADNIDQINAAYRKTLHKGFWKEIMRDKAHIEVGLLDSDLHCDPAYFKSMYRMDMFIQPVAQSHIWDFERISGIRVRNLDDWLAVAENMLDRAIALGAAGVKCGLAYKRTLRFDRVTYAEAEEDFNRVLATRFLPGWEPQKYTSNKVLEDYMMHAVCRMVEKRGLPMQFHTGLMVGGAGNYIDHANPEHLSNLFIEYRDLKFDIFHIAYPYWRTLGAMAEQMHNVYVDMCWAHMISPRASQEALEDWLEFLPLNKIMGFGGDLGGGNAHGVYGAAKLARMNIAKALAKKVEEGLFPVDKACDIGRRLLYDNPKALYNL